MLSLPVNKGLAAIGLGAGLLTMLLSAPAWGLTASAHQDQLCPGDRINQNLGCTANDFTAAATFSAAPNQPSFCVSGQPFEFIVNLAFTSSSALRYDIGFFSSQNGTNILSKTAGNNCSAATFPVTPAPWQNSNANTCGDFAVNSSTTVTVDKIKVLCQGDALGNLQVPYVITYGTSSTTCTDYTDVAPSTSSKCTNGSASVSDGSGGNLQVFAGAYVDVKKVTSPSLDSQPFSFTATASDTAAKVSAGLLAADGSTPNVPPPTTNSATYSNLTDGQTVRFFVNLPSGTATQNLTIAEAATTHWKDTVSISCSQGSVDNATRTMTISNLSSTNPSATCTVTNTKRSRITLVNNVAGRINAGDDFLVQSTGGAPLTDDAGASVSSPRSVNTSGANSAQTIFWSTPGQPLSIADSASSGSLSDYTTSYSCSNALVGSTTAMPSGSTTPFTLTPGDGDNITCTVNHAAKPTLSKVFNKSAIGVEMPATLTFTIANPSGAPARTGLSFTDSLPTNLVVAPTPNVSTSGCGSPTVTATAGATSIGVSAAEVAAGASSCTVNVDVTSSTAASYVNGAAQITAIASTLRNGVSDQTLNVRQVTVSKSYGAAEIFLGGSSLLTFTLTNGTGNPAQGNLTFTDTLATGNGLTITGVTALSGAGCSATTPTYNPTNNPSVTLTGATMTGATCTFTVSVTGNTEGTYANSAANIGGATNPINVTGLGSTLAVARLGITKAFAPATIDIYEPSTMTFTLTNTSSITLTNVNFTDTLTGFSVRTATIGGTCAGTSNSPALAVGATGLNLTVPSLPTGSCTITIPVTSALSGTYNNTTSTVTATGTGGMSGAASNTVTLNVNFLPIQLTKVSSSGATAAPGGAINYTIGYTNPNVATYLQNVVITDPLPPYTTYLSASCGTPLPSSLTSCNIAAPAVGATGTVTWTLGGNLNAGSSGNVYLSVQVQ